MSRRCLPLVEFYARDLALALHGVIADADRQAVMRSQVRHIFEDLVWLHGLADEAAVQHVSTIIARAAVIEDAGRPAPERERIPGLCEFLEHAADRIADLMR